MSLGRIELVRLRLAVMPTGPAREVDTACGLVTRGLVESVAVVGWAGRTQQTINCLRGLTSASRRGLLAGVIPSMEERATAMGHCRNRSR